MRPSNLRLRPPVCRNLIERRNVSLKSAAEDVISGVDAPTLPDPEREESVTSGERGGLRVGG
jgi:hypothetical protein